MIVQDSPGKFITTGVYKRVNDTTMEITELPIGKWTQPYKEFLETLMESNEIIDYKNNCDDTTVFFKIIVTVNKNKQVTVIYCATKVSFANPRDLN